MIISTPPNPPHPKVWIHSVCILEQPLRRQQFPLKIACALDVRYGQRLGS